MKTYNKINPEIIAELKKIAGEKNVITDREKLGNYSHDELNDLKYVRVPDVVVTPETTDQVALVVRLANRENVPVVPRGAGTGFTSGSIPFLGGIVISLERMAKVVEIDRENMFVTVEPGVRTADVQNAVREAGFLYAGDPCSGESSFIGGNVATNAGGNKAIRYGTTRRQVYGLEVVTPEGETVMLGGKCMKDSTGYNLVQLMVGSEGTLGVITRIILKLLPIPKESMDLLIIFPDMARAIGAVPKIMASGVQATCVEFMDNEVINCCGEFLREKLPGSDGGHYIIVKIEGSDPGVLEADSLKIGEICTDSGAIDVLVAEPSKVWKARKAFAEADRAKSLVFSAEDLVVPVSRIPDALEKIGALAKKYNLPVHCAGHAGDGNVHANILKGDLAQDEWDAKLHSFQDDLYSAVYAMGGKLSGEHGIGYKRVGLLEKYAGAVELKMMKAIKKALDPNLILNPGKIFNID